MKSRLSLMIITTIVAALLLSGVVLSRQDEGMIFMPTKNKALYLGWGSYVDTQLNFSSFFNADHTVMAWFMPQYPHASSGPIFAVNGAGKYQIGQDDYRLGDGGPRKDANGKVIGDKGRPVFSIRVGDKKVIYLLDEFIAGQWQHIAVVRRANKFELYLNGMRKSPVKNIDKVTNTSDWGDEITVGSSFASQPSGTLLFGRVSTKRSDSRQAYGLLDDVAVLNKVDPGAYHLHFATGNGVEGTIPAAFTDYYVSTDGNTWTKVLRGHPKAGQFIKRMN